MSLLRKCSNYAASSRVGVLRVPKRPLKLEYHMSHLISAEHCSFSAINFGTFSQTCGKRRRKLFKICRVESRYRPLESQRNRRKKCTVSCCYFYDCLVSIVRPALRHSALLYVNRIYVAILNHQIIINECYWTDGWLLSTQTVVCWHFWWLPVNVIQMCESRHWHKYHVSFFLAHAFSQWQPHHYPETECDWRASLFTRRENRLTP